jgi:hypothetical protein
LAKTTHSEGRKARGSAMIPPVESLVKYDKPVLVSSSRDKTKKGKKDAFGVDKKGKALQTEDILNAILPPRCFPARLARLCSVHFICLEPDGMKCSWF